jgi:hypothetical protein
LVNQTASGCGSQNEYPDAQRYPPIDVPIVTVGSQGQARQHSDNEDCREHAVDKKGTATAVLRLDRHGRHLGRCENTHDQADQKDVKPGGARPVAEMAQSQDHPGQQGAGSHDVPFLAGGDKGRGKDVGKHRTHGQQGVDGLNQPDLVLSRIDLRAQVTEHEKLCVPEAEGRKETGEQ